MKIWTDKNGRVRCKGKGSAISQLREIDAIADYLRKYSCEMRNVSAKVLNTDSELLEAANMAVRRNEIMRSTLETADRQLRASRQERRETSAREDKAAKH
jgi:hypothetical protein